MFYTMYLMEDNKQNRIDFSTKSKYCLRVSRDFIVAAETSDFALSTKKRLALVLS